MNLSIQLDLFSPKPSAAKAIFLHRKGYDYAWPEPQNYDERCIDRVLHSTEREFVLKELLTGKSWAEAAGNSHVGTWGGDIRYQADPNGLVIIEGEAERRLKPAIIVARARQYVLVNQLNAVKE